MTEIISGLHQIGIAEVEQTVAGDLTIDMGGIFYKIAADAFMHNRYEEFKKNAGPVLSYEIDEVDGIPFFLYKEKIPRLRKIAKIGAFMVRGGQTVYTLCLAGQNRSGLMSAMILIRLGYLPQEAISIIQRRRDNALNNWDIKKFILNWCSYDD